MSMKISGNTIFRAIGRAARRVGRSVASVVGAGLLLLTATVHAAPPVCPHNTSVATEPQLDAAISAFNLATSPCTATIQVTADIGLGGSTPAISNSGANIKLNIHGNGHVIDGGKQNGVRPFTIAANTTVTMDQLTVSGGHVSGTGTTNRGGGILNAGDLTLVGCTVTDNFAEGQNGGGIASEGGTLAINTSTIANNTADGNGAGIYHNSDNPLTINTSTISDNTSNAYGGAVFVAGYAVVLIDSATIVDNFAAQQSGGLDVALSHGSVFIDNTILADNVLNDCSVLAPTPQSPPAPTFFDNGHNLFGGSDGGCFGNGGLGNGAGDLMGGNARLKPLAQNGGPTPTRMPRLDSRVIDAGSTAATTDQRGVTRPIGAAADIGAVEGDLCQANTWTVDDPNISTRINELNAAVDCFNAKTAAGAYTLQLDGNVTLSGANTGGFLHDFNNTTPGVSLTFLGNGHQIESVEEAPTQGVYVHQQTTLTINDLHIVGIHSNSDGAGVRNEGTLDMHRCSIELNVTEGSGGGVANHGTMLIDQCLISQNAGSNTNDPGAGGIENFSDGTLTIRNSTISGNSGHYAGGIENRGLLDLDSVTVTANTAINLSTGTNGLRLWTSTATVRNSVLGANGTSDCHVNFGSVTDNGHNLVQSPDNCGFTNGVNADIVGVDPMLGPLHNNGGFSKTHALLSGSPAIDAGATTLTLDQRDKPRPIGPAPDIGAYEDQKLGKLTVKKVAPGTDSTDFDFAISGDPPFVTIPFLLDGVFDLDEVPQSITFDLPAGNYVATESPKTGWTLRTIGCSGVTATTDTVARTATLTLAQNQQGTCTFTNTKDVLTLKYAAGNHGSISGTSPQSVPYGSDGTPVTAVPNTGYHFVRWSDLSTQNPRTDTNVQVDVDVTASFVINTYTLTYSAGPGGTISGNASQTGVLAGDSGSPVTAVPDAGYHFVQWSDGKTQNPRTDTNVQADVNVTATFAANVLVFTTQPADVGQGNTIGTIAVTEQDGSGNTINDNASVDFGSTSDCGDIIFIGSAAMVNGTATLTGTASETRFYTLANGRTLEARAGSLSATSNPFNVVANPEFLFAGDFEECRL